jgi:uncharacterized repeat protein (TIGR03803 family)
MTPDGTITVLHQFAGGSDGSFPFAGVIQAADGNFYGTTSGAIGQGTVFEMTPDGTVSTLHEFTRPDGTAPAAALVEAADGSFYGTTALDGAAAGGVVFRLKLVFTLTASPDAVGAGDPITARWTAPPGRSAVDWIGLYAVGAPNTDPIEWQYTNGASCGSVTMTAPDTPGQYEFRYLLNDGFTDAARSNSVTVK